MKELLEHILIFTIIIILASLCFFILIYPLGAIDCHNKWDNKFQPNYELIGGCLVKINNQYVPESTVKFIQ